MAKVEKDATLVSGPSLAQFVIGQLLDGLKVKVVVDGAEREGVVHTIDVAQGSDHLFAQVKVPLGLEQDLGVRVAIERDGAAHVLAVEE